MAVALKYDNDDKLLYTPGGAVANKAVVQLNDQCFITAAAIAAGEEGVIMRRGTFSGVAKPTDEAWTLNQALYWDVSASEFTIDDDTGNNKYAGRAGAAADTAAATGTIVLNTPL